MFPFWCHSEEIDDPPYLIYSCNTNLQWLFPTFSSCQLLEASLELLSKWISLHFVGFYFDFFYFLFFFIGNKTFIEKTEHHVHDGKYSE